MHEPLSPHQLSLANKLARALWQLVWLALYRPTPTFMHAWRRMLLRLFGARIGAGVHPYPSARVWAPWNLTMEPGSCLAPQVDCYCVAPVMIGQGAVVSQYSYLCTASHDHTHPAFPLIAAPISIGAKTWVAADAFIGPGVIVGAGAVVGARATVVKHVAPWTIVAGNPARVVGERPSGTSDH